LVNKENDIRIEFNPLRGDYDSEDFSLQNNIFHTAMYDRDV